MELASALKPLLALSFSFRSFELIIGIVDAPDMRNRVYLPRWVMLVCCAVTILTGPLFAQFQSPLAVARTTQTGTSAFSDTIGPRGTAIYALVRDSVGTLYAGGRELYRSTDQGTTWQSIQRYMHVSALAIGPTGALLAGYAFGPITRSTDGGLTWQTSAGVFGDSVLFIKSEASGRVYAGTSQGTFKSTNGGATFTAANIPLTPSYDVLEGHDGRIMAATGGGVYISTDLGSTWSVSTNGFPSARSFAKTTSGAYFALTSAALYRSLDTGATWSAVRTINDGRRLVLKNDSILYIITTRSGVLWSQDAGLTWSEMNSGLETREILCLTLLPDGRAIAGAALGVYSSEGGEAAWARHTQGLRYPELRDLAAAPNGMLFAAAYGGVHRTTDNGVSWGVVNNGFAQTDIYSISASEDGVLTAGAIDGMYRSTDNGEHWTYDSPVLTRRSRVVANSAGHLFDPGLNDGVSRSLDSGRTWSRVMTYGNALWPGFAVVNANGFVYVVDRFGFVFESRDNGTSWTHFDTQSLNWVEGLIVDTAGHLCLATTHQGILRTGSSTAPAAIANRVLTTRLDLGRRRIQRAFDTVLTVYNIGSATLHVNAVTSSDGAFVPDRTAFEVPGHGVVHVTIQSSLPSLGDRSALIILQHDGGQIADTVRATAFGYGVPRLRFQPPSIDFGGVKLYAVRDTAVRVFNDGDDTLKVFSRGSASIAIMARHAIPPLLPGADFSDTLRFEPDGIGQFNGIMVLHTNTEASAETLSVRGAGLPVPLITIFNSVIDFGRVIVGSTKKQYVNFFNGGQATLVIKPVVSSDPVFQPLLDSVSLEPDHYWGIGINYTPTKGGRDSAVVSLHTNTFLGVQDVTVMGTGDPSLTTPDAGQPITSFALLPNYPNPFNPSTTIRFDLPVRSFVQLRVYSILGQLVDVLAEGEHGPGSMKREWTPTDASGVYFVCMDAWSSADRSRRFSAVQKVVFAR